MRFPTRGLLRGETAGANAGEAPEDAPSRGGPGRFAGTPGPGLRRRRFRAARSARVPRIAARPVLSRPLERVRRFGGAQGVRRPVPLAVGAATSDAQALASPVSRPPGPRGPFLSGSCEAFPVEASWPCLGPRVVWSRVLPRHTLCPCRRPRLGQRRESQSRWVRSSRRAEKRKLPGPRPSSEGA